MQFIVFGSAHLDIYSTPQVPSGNVSYRLGKVRYFVGGTAFNIAKNLARNDVQVGLFTHLPQNKYFSKSVADEIAECGIIDSYIFFDDAVSESGFIAVINKDHHYESILSCIEVESAGFDRRNVNKAIQNAKFVVCDCNLSVDQIRTIYDASYTYSKPMIVASTSKAKVKRYLSFPIKDDKPFFLVSVNEAEALEVDPDVLEKIETDGISVLDRFKTTNLILSVGEDGYYVVTRSGTRKYRAPDVTITGDGSELGAGDALISAHLVCLSQGSIDWDRAHSLANQMISTVLKIFPATPQVILPRTRPAPPNETSVASLLPVEVQIHQIETGIKAALIVAGSTLIAALIGAFWNKLF